MPPACLEARWMHSSGGWARKELGNQERPHCRRRQGAVVRWRLGCLGTASRTH